MVIYRTINTTDTLDISQVTFTYGYLINGDITLLLSFVLDFDYFPNLNLKNNSWVLALRAVLLVL